MDVNAISNGDGGIFATTCCKTVTIGKHPVSFFENFKHMRSFVPTYPDEAFMQEVLAQIVWHQNPDIFLQQLVAKLPSECKLTCTLSENLKFISIEELEMNCQRYPISRMPSHLLSWSHYVELPKMDNNLECYSVAELKRQKALAMFLRLAAQGQLTRALPENLRYSLPSIEELEAELGGIHQEESGDE